MYHTNNEPITRIYDLYDVVAFCIVAPAYSDEYTVTQTPYQTPYDYWVTDTSNGRIVEKGEIKVRHTTYPEFYVEIDKVRHLCEERAKDEDNGDYNIKYVFQYPDTNSNLLYTVDLDDVLESPLVEVILPEKTVEQSRNRHKQCYKVELNRWTAQPLDCHKYNYYIKKGREKYGL